jgi:hypothetical protein
MLGLGMYNNSGFFLFQEGTVIGYTQLYSVESCIKRLFDCHTATFSTIKLDTNCQPSTLLIYAVREDYGGKVNVALWVIFDAKTGNCCIVGTI